MNLVLYKLIPNKKLEPGPRNDILLTQGSGSNQTVTDVEPFCYL